jgi:DUF1009 family protein
VSENDPRTPPQIVAASNDPVSALVAFIAQELEHWGFKVVDAKSRAVLVKAEAREFMVGAQEVRA